MHRFTTLTIAALATIATACGSSSSTSSATTVDPAKATDTVTITKAWARTSPAQANTGAAYFTAVSTIDDQLIAAKVDASIAKTTEMHQTAPVGASNLPSVTGGGMPETSVAGSDTSMSATTMAGATGATMDATASTTGAGATATTMAPAMAMTPVDSIDIKAGSSLVFAPGGYHVMLKGLVKPLVAGQTFPLTLTFAKAGKRTVTITVRDDAP
jgi:copper(I)-binding protein